MSTKDLREKYGGGNKQAMQRAIRAEVPGGSQVLDGLDTIYKMIGPRDDIDRAVAGAAMEILASIKAAMESEIRQRYGIPPASEEIFPNKPSFGANIQ